MSALSVAVRAYAPAATPRRTRKRSSWRRPELTLVFDTETTIDPTQRLTFGVYQVVSHGATIDAGLFHADDLDETSLATLRD